MIRGLYIAATGMVDQMARMDTISNNLANVNTAAFKKDYNVTRSFPEILMDRQGYTDASLKKPDIGTINYGVWSGGIYTDLSQGSFQKTDNPLDLAIDGNGFFAVQSGNRVLYTRDGRFTRGSNGLLVTTEGMPVLGVNGVINLPQGQVTVNPNGDIYVNGNYVDTLRLVDINGGNGGAITKFGDNLITGPIGNRPVGGIRQGYVEASNVNPIEEMVDMIEVTRAYEANQKVITAMDDTLNKAVNEVGRI
ncbi:flagellar basal-body rod protein FlgF [Caldanaerobius polysaccharolyticus]|uniref:flagellar basal-body rod protein FlgF n=1 Tax=Caldanaerobius polysaccharolyticus TaxID=44256 RepID=UPI00047A5DBF|nr:flagellar basal-body rod protein FlgF [Caldanaerobius polysaccharolyticus]